MADQFILVYDALTGITTEKKLTATEIAEIETANQISKAAEEAIQAKVAARESALAKLAALGLTEAEIAAL